jgi:hypothetical protein
MKSHRSPFQHVYLLFIPVLALLSQPASVRSEKILFVGGQPDAAQGDDAVVLEHLMNLKHDVTYMVGADSSTEDGETQDAIIISSTLGSGTVRHKFQDLAVPILQWEEALVRWEHAEPDGNFRMSQNSRNGETRETTIIVIRESAVGHPLAGGLPAGEHEIFTDVNRTPQQYGELAPGLIAIAELDPEFATDDASLYPNGSRGPELVLSAVDTGAELGPPGEGFTAPARRVNFPIEDVGFGLLNEKGIRLFDCALEWVLGRSCVDEGMRGDYNMNGSLDTGDLDAMAAAIVAKDPSLDLNGDRMTDFTDRMVWVHELKKTWFGDANLDGEFNSQDLVSVFQAGKFETRSAATWSEGDWNADQVFDSGDFVVAFVDGGYERGPRPAVSSVPEPSGLAVLLLGCVGLRLGARRNEFVKSNSQ